MTGALQGRTALVTGSSHNLGLAIALELAEQGADVVVHGMHEPIEAAAAIRAAVPGARVASVGFDLAVPDAVAAGFASLATRGLVVDVLVNNAAHLGMGEDRSLDTTPQQFRDVLEVNVFGTYLCSMLAVRGMVEAGGGSIVNISSLAGQRAIHDRLAYNTSKAAIDGMTRSMAIDFAEHHVRVNAIAPGYVWSDRWEHIDDEEAARRRARIPVGEPTMQQEIASLVAYLASGSAPTLTGEVIAIDGGLAAQQSPREATAS